MSLISEIEFVVDEQYENEKGVFTVLSIHRNEMVIRWESGEEIRTDLELQRNIQARRQWEQEQKEKEARAAKTSPGKHGTAGTPGFSGLRESDFKTSAGGTRWRGRNQLGGAVTHKMPDSRFDFNSWAYANKPEMHWLDVEHKKKQAPERGARFFVRVDRKSLYFGFSITRPEDAEETNANWQAFTQWLANENNDRLLQTMSEENKLSISGGTERHPLTLKSQNETWYVDNGKKQQDLTSASAFMDQLPSSKGMTLEVARVINKNDAIASGKKIAEDIARLFSRLMPLYQAAWPVVS